jgi:large subunit ribosomal protein L7/L12
MADEENKNPEGEKAEEAKVPAPEEKQEEAPKEEKAPEGAGDDSKDVEVPEKFKKLVEEIEKMSVLELNELVKVLEKKFGVSAAAMSVAGPAAGGAEGAEEQSSFDVELADSGAQKIAVIKAVKEALGLGLKEAKDLVDGAPSMLKQGMKKEEANELKEKIEAAGGKVNLK